MNISFVNATHRWGGVKTWAMDFAVALKERGHGVSVFGRPGPFVDKARERGLLAASFSFGPDYNPLAIGRFVKLFRQLRTHAVIGNVARDVRTAGIAARMLGLAFVQQIGLPGDMKNKWDTRLMHRLLRPHYLCSCDYIRDGFLQEMDLVDVKDTSVVLTAKPVPEAYEPVPPREPLRLVTTCQLMPEKGHADLIPALGNLRRAGREFQWHVLGTGHDEQKLKELAREQGLGDAVVWHGFVTNVTEFLKDMDVFVLPSKSEGLPNTLQEAMAAGLVTVSRDVGGVKDVWHEDIRDLLVPFDSGAEGFERALEVVFQAEPDTLVGWKELSWKQARALFHLPDKVTELERLLVRLTGMGQG